MPLKRSFAGSHRGTRGTSSPWPVPDLLGGWELSWVLRVRGQTQVLSVRHSGGTTAEQLGSGKVGARWNGGVTSEDGEQVAGYREWDGAPGEGQALGWPCRVLVVAVTAVTQQQEPEGCRRVRMVTRLLGCPLSTLGEMGQ